MNRRDFLALQEHADAIAKGLRLPRGAKCSRRHGAIGDTFSDGTVVTQQLSGPRYSTMGIARYPMNKRVRDDLILSLNTLIEHHKLDRFLAPPLVHMPEYVTCFSKATHRICVRGVLGFGLNGEPLMRFDIIGGSHGAP